MTSLGDDARETLTIAGLEKAKERALEQHLRLRAPQTWTLLCASVDQYLRKAGYEKARCRFRNAKCSNYGKTRHLRGAMCRQREKTTGKSSPSSSVEALTSATVVDKSVIDDLIALVETRVPASGASVVI